MQQFSHRDFPRKTKRSSLRAKWPPPEWKNTRTARTVSWHAVHTHPSPPSQKNYIQKMGCKIQLSLHISEIFSGRNACRDVLVPQKDLWLNKKFGTTTVKECTVCMSFHKFLFFQMRFWQSSVHLWSPSPDRTQSVQGEWKLIRREFVFTAADRTRKWCLFCGLNSHRAWGQGRTLPRKWSWIEGGGESVQGQGPNFPQEVICKLLQYLDKWMIKGSKFLTTDQDYHNFSGFYIACLQKYVSLSNYVCAFDGCGWQYWYTFSS